MSRCVENCQKYLPKSHCSLIQGTKSKTCKVKKEKKGKLLHKKLDIVAWIGEQLDVQMFKWQFSRHPDMLVVPRKLLETN